jgi:hypothetical protein
MITLVFFLMLLSYGLGYFTNLIVVNIKALDEMVERSKREEEERAQKFKKSVDEVIADIVKPTTLPSTSNNLKDLKATLKK